jgi:hypothetical protein
MTDKWAEFSPVVAILPKLWANTRSQICERLTKLTLRQTEKFTLQVAKTIVSLTRG